MDPALRERALREIYTEYDRVLKPGGRLLIQTNKQLLQQTRNFKTDIVKRYYRRWVFE